MAVRLRQPICSGPARRACPLSTARRGLHGAAQPLPLRARDSLVPASSNPGKEAVGSWLDLAKFVAQGTNKSPYQDLASSIGRDVYADIAGWHLYMRDMGAAAGSGGKMAQALAECLGPQARNGLRAADVEAVLRKIPVRLGGGRNTLPLYDLMPSACVNDLVQILEDFARK